MKLSYIRLLVEKFDDCFIFYSEKLGFPVTWGKIGDMYASFEVNDSLSLSIFSKQNMMNHINENIIKQRGNSQMVVVFETEDIDLLYSSLIKKGVVFQTKPTIMPGWGIKCAHLYDPEKNLIEINQLLHKDDWSNDLVDSMPII